MAVGIMADGSQTVIFPIGIPWSGETRGTQTTSNFKEELCREDKFPQSVTKVWLKQNAIALGFIL